jgi:hypothetical protein
VALRDGMLERHGRIMSEDRIADTRRYALAERMSQPPRGARTGGGRASRTAGCAEPLAPVRRRAV